jgi:large subunit ribosomal protein L25
MAEIILKAETGRPTGSAVSRRLRAEGRVPAVVYGPTTEPQSISVDWRELRAALTTDKALNAVITLDVDGNRQLSVVKELQRHPLKRNVLHVDFLAVDRNKPISAEVPLVLAGEATKVAAERGVMEQALSYVVVSAKPDAIPGHIDVDVTDLEVGTTITVADITPPVGVTIEDDPEQAVVTASVTRAVEAEAEAAAEDEEGEAAAGGEEAASEGEGE